MDSFYGHQARADGRGDPGDFAGSARPGSRYDPGSTAWHQARVHRRRGGHERSPVYIGNKLLGSLSYRIGSFSKDPIAGITPIEQMLEVREIPISPTILPTERAQGNAFSSIAGAGLNGNLTAGGSTFQAMETPLVMSGFQPEAVRLWQQKMAGTGLEMVAAGGGSGSSLEMGDAMSAPTSIVPGSAVSAQLVRGDMEIAATCTVTYVDPKQLLACGHPLLQAGPVSLPMTTTEVVATLASPLNAFKIINTGRTHRLIHRRSRCRYSRRVWGAPAHDPDAHCSRHSRQATQAEC